MITEPCYCCGTSVELVMLDVDGKLHTCPQPYLDRWLLGQRRKPVDERWWERMQAPGEPESHEAPPPSTESAGSPEQQGSPARVREGNRGTGTGGVVL